MEWYIGERFFPSKAEAMAAALPMERIQEYRGQYINRMLASDGTVLWVRNNYMGQPMPHSEG